MPLRFIDRYKFILFDVCGTLMFDYDRYGPGQDYHPAYTRLGGNRLAPFELADIIHQMASAIAAAEKIPANWDPFPAASDFLDRIEPARRLDAAEREAVLGVFAEHECGAIQDWVISTLRQVAQTHPTGSISNLWSNPVPFERELARCALDRLFQPRLWSSDLGCIKPAVRIFQAALDAIPYPPQQVLYVGDTFRCDVFGPKRLGMGAAWVNPRSLPIPAEYGVEPDRIIRSIELLLSIE
jgi:FMN phosphatase YigB (HAD superfamily)